MGGSQEITALLLYISSLLGFLLLSMISSKIYIPRYGVPEDRLLIYLLREGLTVTYLKNIKGKSKSDDDLCRRLRNEEIPNYSSIAKELGISPSNMTNYIKELEEGGLIEVVQCGNEKHPFVHERSAKLVSRTVLDIFWENIWMPPNRTDFCGPSRS